MILFDTLLIFLWKHYKCIRSTWLSMLLSISMPVAMAFFIMYLMNSLEVHVTNTPQQDLTARYEVVEKVNLYHEGNIATVYYAPNTTENFGVMERVRELLSVHHEQFVGFASESDLDNHTQQRFSNFDYSVVFDASNDTHNEYSIRFAPTDDLLEAPLRQGNFYDATKDSYLYSGFVTLQLAIDESLLAMREPTDTPPTDIRLQKLPSDVRRLVNNYRPFGTVALITMFVYVLTIVNMVLVPMVEEKELGIREFLRIVTCYYQLNLVSFYVLHLAIGVLIFGSVLALAVYYGLAAHFSIGCAMVLVVLYVCSLVAYAYMVSVLFSTMFYAKNAGFMLFMVPWAARFYTPVKFLMPVVSMTMFDDAWQLMDEYGARAQVFGWSDVAVHHADSVVPFSMLTLWAFLLADTVGYLLLYTYLVQVFPGTYGTPQPYYFPALWLGRLCGLFGRTSAAPVTNGRDDETDATACGGGDADAEVVVRVRGLTKVFGSPWGGDEMRAVDNVNMDICANQITVLLGHNGAGKTTMMSIISGIVPKTSGEISVNGERDVNVYRKQIGYCPQHNVFLPYFTCMDHLMFFGRLRGLTKAEANSKSRSLLERLHLSDKANENGKNLSGGMKRRLCLGNALIGDTKIAILDEPSSGLDPESRRELWNILIEMRKQNTILITTHYMEEAEALSDYVSIMSRGQILCHGTTLQLKRRYADGYVLKLLTTDRFETSQTLARLQYHIPDARVKSFVKPTLSVTLPYQYMDAFAAALADLEEQAAQLGIESMSLTNASLEEVFLNSDPHKHTPEVNETNSQTSDQVDASSYSPLSDNKFNINCRLWNQQVLAVFYKKSIYWRRHWIRLLGTLFMLMAALFFGLRTSNDPAPQTVTASSPVTHLFDPDKLSGGRILLQLTNPDTAEAVRRFDVALSSLLSDHQVEIHKFSADGDLEKALLAIEKTDILAYHENTYCALSVSQPDPSSPLDVLILYSGNQLVSTPLCVNLVTNVLDRMQSLPPLHLVTVSRPMPVHFRQLVRQPADDQGAPRRTDVSFDWYRLLIPPALFFYMLLFVQMPFAETQTEFKHLQIIPPSLYWAAYLAADMLLHLMICTVMFGAHLLFDRAGALTPSEHAQLVGWYAMYGLAYLPLVYVTGQVFSSLSTVYSVLTYIFVLPSVPATIFTLSTATLERFADWVAVLLMLPDYALRHALNVFLLAHPPFGGDQPQPEPLPEVMRLEKVYVYMALEAVVLMTFLVLVLENIYKRAVLVRVLRFYRPVLRVLRCGRGGTKKSAAVEAEATLGSVPDLQTAAVDGERDQTDAVCSGSRQADYAIVVSKLRKVYDGDLTAVAGVDFTVRRGECFGLLGMNGAGKTTAFKMMTRQLTITEGGVYINGLDSRRDVTRYRFMFGYCPQADALNGWMTAFETLKYMGMARGTRWAELDVEVQKLLESTDLAAYGNVLASKFSGGTKRKLNTAMAIQSDPLLVFLDEPTTGVDPSSRRFMWACIQECQRQNKNIVLTSHSMDECEFLCNRLAIMNHGRLNCIGPIQQLKRTFELGYLITVLLRTGWAGSERSQALKTAMLHRFECALSEEYGNQMCFRAQNTNPRWSDIVAGVQQLKQQFADCVDDISLSESSLEDIFLKIARDSHKRQAQTA